MTIKYEPVFGDQSLFYNAQADCEMVGNGHHKVEHGKLMVWNFSEKYWAESHTSKISMEAMRRIIKTPTWTRADQEAGVLPPVGSIFTYRDETLTCHFIDGDGEIWAHDIDNKIVTPLLRDCRPIETPEERAQRLRDEWCSECTSKYYPRGHKGFPEMIYDALLSGELKAPSND